MIVRLSNLNNEMEDVFFLTQIDYINTTVVNKVQTSLKGLLGVDVPTDKLQESLTGVVRVTSKDGGSNYKVTKNCNQVEHIRGIRVRIVDIDKDKLLH